MFLRISFRCALAFIALSLAGCGTTSLTSDIPNAPRLSPGSNVPTNYRQVIAEYMRSQVFNSMAGIHNVQIAGPFRRSGGIPAGFQEVDFFCVRAGDSYLFTSFYWFKDGKMGWANGGSAASGGIVGGALTYAMICGSDAKFVPFPEAEFTPQR